MSLFQRYWKPLVVTGVFAIMFTYFVIAPYLNPNQPLGSGSIQTTNTEDKKTISTGLTQTSSSQTSTTRQGHSVPLDQIVSGGPPPDGIPSIDKPKFLQASKADFLTDSDFVIGINYNGEVKAYPLLILVWHEIVNDFVGGKPIAITYCPLCYSSLAFVREINGQTVEFGTSGKLYNNNLVMYDRLTKSLWSEMWGEAIRGSLTGYKLERVPIDVLRWGVWKAQYPNTLVLSTDTGYRRDYGSDPYDGYYTNPDIYFPLSRVDERLSLKTVVMGVSLNDTDRAYPLRAFSERGKVITDTLANQKLVFFTIERGVARLFIPFVDGRELHFQYSNGNFVDVETQSVWSYDGVSVSGPMQGKSLIRLSTVTTFWFSWAAFYPETQIYTA